MACAQVILHTQSPLRGSYAFAPVNSQICPFPSPFRTHVLRGPILSVSRIFDCGASRDTRVCSGCWLFIKVSSLSSWPCLEYGWRKGISSGEDGVSWKRSWCQGHAFPSLTCTAPGTLLTNTLKGSPEPWLCLGSDRCGGGREEGTRQMRSPKAKPFASALILQKVNTPLSFSHQLEEDISETVGEM